MFSTVPDAMRQKQHECVHDRNDAFKLPLPRQEALGLCSVLLWRAVASDSDCSLVSASSWVLKHLHTLLVGSGHQ